MQLFAAGLKRPEHKYGPANIVMPNEAEMSVEHVNKMISNIRHHHVTRFSDAVVTTVWLDMSHPLTSHSAKDGRLAAWARGASATTSLSISEKAYC